MTGKFAIDGVTALTPLAEAAPALLEAKARPLFELEDAARGGADMDAVHDMRVASRRLREAMRLLEPLYGGADYRRWYRRVRRITRSLGPVRDSDVFIDHFTGLGEYVGDQGRRAIAFFVGYRMGQREHELAALNEELAQLDLAGSIRSFSRMARGVGGGPGAQPLVTFAHAAVAERAAVVFGAQPAALVEANVAEQHALRIDYKRLRYAVEALAPCYGDEFEALHGTLTAFQDALGELHDAHIFADMVRDPGRVDSARRAGVTDAGTTEVLLLLEARAKEWFDAFVRLAKEHPAEQLLPQLLAPLAGAAAPSGLEASEPPPGLVIEPLPELPIISPVIVGAEPWNEDPD